MMLVAVLARLFRNDFVRLRLTIEACHTSCVSWPLWRARVFRLSPVFPMSETWLSKIAFREALNYGDHCTVVVVIQGPLEMLARQPSSCMCVYI